ncbi:hypothetical protein [Blastococcus sp. SYSU DS0539]
MEDRSDAARNEQPRPPADATAAGAFAPPPGGGRSVLTFLAATVLLVCGVTGVLSFFTDLPWGYRVLLLGAAALAAVALVLNLRRGRRGLR